MQQRPFLETIPDLSWDNRPSWLTITPAEAARAQRLLTPEFWNDRYPLSSPAYKEIGFPLSVGFAEEEHRAAVLNADAFRNAADEQFNRRFAVGPCSSDLEHFEADTRFSAGLFRQILAADKLIYGQNSVRADLSVDIATLRAGWVHRSINGVACFEQPMHTDFPFNKSLIMDPAIAAFRESKPVDNFNLSLKMATGIMRIYAVVSECPTEFANARSFQPWEIVHFIAEPHRSPKVPEALRRAFFRAIIHPV